VQDTGLRVVLGGMTIDAGGASIKGQLSMIDSGIYVALGGISVASTGLSVTGGVTVQDTGLKVVAGGVSITAGGLKVAGGLTISDTGLLLPTNGLTVSSGGVIAANGLTITAGGLRVTTTGAIVAGGVSVSSGGVFVTGGMTVYGDIKVSTTISTIPSDRRLKTNLAPIVGALHKVSRLNGVYFNWITNEPSGLSYDRDRHIGLIAQEVQAVIPEAVSPVEEGKYLGVDYVSMIPVVIEAIRELDELWKEGKVTMSERTQLRTGLLAELTLVFNNLTSRLDALDQSLVDFKAKAALLSSRLDQLQYW